MEKLAKDSAAPSVDSSQVQPAAEAPAGRAVGAAVPGARAPAEAAEIGYGPTVREVLGVASLAGSTVRAGAAGLGRVVRRLNVMEVPDILPWVKPHELLLTTGYPLRHAPEKLTGLLGELDERGLAGIAIKLHRYLDEIPAAMLEEADRRGFPLIEVPVGVGFDDVMHDVLSDLLNRQAAVLARAEEVHRALVTVVLEGGGLDDLAEELARILTGAVMITTPDGRVVARAGDPADLDRATHPACFDPSGRFLAEDEPIGAREHGAGHHAVVPVVAGRVDHGRIAAFAGRPLTDSDVHALERAATVAALAITKQLAVAAVEGKYRADFLRDLLTDRVDDVQAAVVHARSLGWNIARPMVAVVAELDPDDTPPADPAVELRPVHERFAAAWQTVVRWRDAAAPVVNFNREVVVLIPPPPDGDVDRLVADLVRQVSGDGGGGRRPFSLGVSRLAPTPEELPRAYEQARKAVQIGRRLQGNSARASFDRLGVHRLLSLIPDSAELRSFVAETLGELAADSPENDDLRRTLSVLLETNINVAESARRLHFHYNTLRYRIGKLERMVGGFTDDATLQLDLALALRVLELRGL